MPVGTVPVVGRTYSVLCPICSNTVNFDCISTAVYGIQCHVCRSLIDLRDPSVPLPPNDPCVLADQGEGDVCFSPEVEESGGCSATTQLYMVVAGVVEQQQKEMPTKMSGETMQAFSARRIQALSERFSFLYPLVHAIEYIIFGTNPVAKIGNVRIFRKQLPCCRPVNIPVPQTSVSYAVVLALIVALYTVVVLCAQLLHDEWMWRMVYYEGFFILVSLIAMLRCVYMDPGFVRPAYLEGNDNGTDELTLKDIEAKSRESRWETVEGQPVERKWCSTCEIYRPMRAAHCYFCGLCVQEHDHHCSVIGVCVGRRNVRSFILFLFAIALVALFPGVCLLLALYDAASSLTPWSVGICLALSSVLLFLSASVTFICATMLYSLTIEQTTRERLQDVYTGKKNPFSRGVLRNIHWHMWHRTPPSLFDDEFVHLCATRV
ncbi:S-acyltransferase [Trypanosoma conorhini]|uniref:Palmitoyltransferase n=1 Tax=Trypanosoma conorhini TaxID=83891 RepID=A0A3R7PMA2_9TRYP|nr:S-acyltransferase [Trypanosoma conorhini]RNF27526.1 S-acyltransferase [Trypanosoma conorhini]